MNYLKEQKIDWKEYDEKPMLQAFNSIIKENRINATPTCVIRYSSSDSKKYIGIDEIRDGLSTLKSQLKGQSCMYCRAGFSRHVSVSSALPDRTITLPDFGKLKGPFV